MSTVSPLKHGFVDMAAVLFVIGGVVSLVMGLLMIPVASVYPLIMPTNFSFVFLVVLGVTLICSFGAIHCYSLATKRMLSEAGIRGIVFGALLLMFSLGVIGTFAAPNTSTLLTTLSSSLIIIGGIICFSLRHTNVSASAIARQHMIAKPSFQTQ